MAIELEVKVRLRPDEVPLVRKQLEALGADRVGAHLEQNLIFDTEDGHLRDTDQVLRLRKIGGRTSGWLTYKGPRLPGVFKQREELEQLVHVQISETDPLERILAALGYRLSFLYEKRREVWQCEEAEVVIDEVPQAGWFVEIEAEDAERIHAMLRELRLDARPQEPSYIAILVAECDLPDDRPTVVTFG